MAFRPFPVTYRCPRCGWSKTVHPCSDALIPGEFFDVCPDCGRPHPDCRLAVRPTSPLYSLWRALKGGR
jgi:hypothetical protein